MHHEGMFFDNSRNAYVEFADSESAEHAIYLSGVKLRNRAIKVQPKRTNIKGMSKGGFKN